jgi:hypothetical protein
LAGQGYLASFDIEFASNNSSCIGMGGSEASVYLKAGGTTYQPVTEVGQVEEKTTCPSMLIRAVRRPEDGISD